MNTRLAFTCVLEISFKFYGTTSQQNEEYFSFFLSDLRNILIHTVSKDIALRVIIYLLYGKLRFIIQQNKETPTETHQKYRPRPFL